MKLHLQLNLDALGPSYQPDKPYYALLVSAALEPENNESVDQEVVGRFLRVWDWMPLETLSVYGRRADFSDAWTALAHTVVRDSTTPNGLAQLRARLNAELDGQRQASAFSPDDFTWVPNPADQAIERRALKPGNEPRRGRDWRAFLTHVGTYPGGLGIHLRLSVFFHLEAVPPADYLIVAAPWVQFEAGGKLARPSTPTSNAGDPLQAIDIKIDGNTAHKEVFRWKYEGHDTLTVDAFVNRPKPLPPPQQQKSDDEAVIDLSSLWRRKVALGPPTNWLAQLAERMTSAVDLPTSLLKYLGTLGNKSVPNGFRQVFRTALFEVVRPAILADRIAPSGATLQEAILFTVAPAQDFDFRDTAMPQDWESGIPEPGATASAYLAALDEAWRGIATTHQVATRVVLLWKHAYRGKEEWDPLEKRLLAALEIDSLRERLLLQTVGPLWRALFPSGSMPIEGELPLLAKALADQVRGFANDVLDFMPDAYRDVLEREVADVFAAPADQVSADPTSDGITIQIDRVGGQGRLNGRDDHDDYLRRLSGTGVLVRRKGDTDWRALNMATLGIRPDADPKAEPAPVGGPLAFPVRFQYSQEVRQAFISYQNQPLVAESPWARLNAGSIDPTRGTALATPLFQLLSPYKREDGQQQLWKLPRLQYGKRYETAVYYFGTTGALPAALCEGNGTAAAKPWRFALPSALDTSVVTEVAYLRRCPVGPLRLEEDPLTRKPFPPRYPGRVFPLTADLLRPDYEKQALLERAPEPPQLPLVLVLPPNPGAEWDVSKGIEPSASFLLRPPSLDVKVWERWQEDALQEEAKAARARIISELFTLLNAHANGARKNEDPTLDDPAVTKFTVTFVRVDRTSAPSTKGPFDFGAPGASAGLGSEQRSGRRVVVASSSDEHPGATIDKSGVLRLTVPDGEIWRIDFAPVIDGIDRFIDEQPKGKKSFREWLTEPTGIHVEVTSSLFTRGDHFERNASLHAALLLTMADANPQRPASEPANLGLQVELTRKPLGPVARLIHRTEVLLQRWRWDGRPVYVDAQDTEPMSGLPFAALGELEPDFANDGALFADRRDSDYLVVPGAVDLTRPDSVAVIAHAPFGGNRGVLYYRVAARAHSRYEGLMHDGHALDSSAVGTTPAPRRWRRYVVPLRWHDRVPKPLIKLIVPLTETVAGRGAANAPGWMVLVDEPWYSETLGGLGEYLESRLDHVALPDNAAETRPQFGADPILAMPDDPLANVQLTLTRPTGAFGWTFDSDTTAPLYVKSCFYQTPPAHDQLPDDLSFYFLKLRFRRVLAGSDALHPRADEQLRRSEYTEPYWVQVLPPANRWHIERDHAAAVWASADELTLAPGATALRYKATPVTAVRAVDTTSAFAVFRVYALITRRVFDAFGRHDQETLVTIVPIESLGKASIGEGSALRLRLIEVQFRAPLPSALTAQGGAVSDMLEPLVDALFKGALDDPNSSAPQPARDAGARIVRMSPPIDQA